MTESGSTDEQTPAEQTATLAELIAADVREHPSVARLDGGPYGVVASYLIGGRVVGVRAGSVGEPVELSVVLRLGRPIPEVVAELRAVARAHAGDVPVDVGVNDLVTGDEPTDGAPEDGAPTGHRGDGRP